MNVNANTSQPIKMVFGLSGSLSMKMLFYHSTNYWISFEILILRFRLVRGLKNKNMIYTSINHLIRPLSFVFQRDRIRKFAKAKLLQEINFNLRLIDILEWKDVSIEFKNKIIGEFTIKEFENFLEVCSEDFLDILSKKTFEFENENLDDSQLDKQELISGTINKIKTLQLIATFNKNFESDNKAKLEVRLRNIKKSLNELKQTLIK